MVGVCILDLLQNANDLTTACLNIHHFETRAGYLERGMAITTVYSHLFEFYSL